MTSAAPRRRAAGFSLIEGMVAILVAAVGMLGLATLQTISARANRFGTNMATASALALDLGENIKRWSWNDARITPKAVVTTTTAAAVNETWDMGRAAAATVKAQYGEKAGDANATNPGALGTYQGLSGDVDGDGTLDFVRYWNVYDLDLGNTGNPQGKLIQIIVRWNEPGVGMRQVAVSTFKPNTQALFL